MSAMLGGAAPFAGHGYLVTLRIDGPGVPAIIAGLTGPTDRP